MERVVLAISGIGVVETTFVLVLAVIGKARSLVTGYEYSLPLLPSDESQASWPRWARYTFWISLLALFLPMMCIWMMAYLSVMLGAPILLGYFISDLLSSLQSTLVSWLLGICGLFVGAGTIVYVLPRAGQVPYRSLERHALWFLFFSLLGFSIGLVSLPIRQIMQSTEPILFQTIF